MLSCSSGRPRSSIEVELQHVSLIASETKSAQDQLQDYMLGIDTNISRAFQGQEDKFAAVLEILNRIASSASSPPQAGVLLPARQGTITSHSTTGSQVQVVPTKPKVSTHYNSLVVLAKYRSHVSCGPRCFCACHEERKVETPSFLRNMIGRLFIGYIGFPILSRSCELVFRSLITYRENLFKVIITSPYSS